jgi:glycerate 2-kinase
MLEKNAVLSKLRMPRNGRTLKGVPLIEIGSSETPVGEEMWHRDFPSRDALEILKRYRLLDRVPSQVRSHLERVHDDPAYDAYAIPIHSAFRYEPTYRFRVIGPEDMIRAVESRAAELGVAVHLLCPSINDIEAGPVAATMASIARNVEINGKPFKPPCVLLIGGELTVSTEETDGVGGRCQEFALSIAPWIQGSDSIVAAAVDSDGTDGPTEVAGGIVDGGSFDRASKSGINIFRELEEHNSYEVLTRLEDTIQTGALGQNLRSLYMITIGAAE